MFKKTVVVILALALVIIMTSTVLAGTKEYKGRCKNQFDTLTFDNYLTAHPGEYMDVENYYNYKYSYTSGVTVNFTCGQSFDNDYTYYNYDQASGDWGWPIRNDMGRNVVYHILMKNDYYTGNYMYTNGRYLTY